ncbi:MAG: glycosyltransferase family 9 protein [Bacteroidetes bacterium]|nr:glycosyltransferase family 9 protein [Bacteroidota bacterium]
MGSLKKILIIRFSSIGDIVLTTPIIRCLKQQLPGSVIHYLTKRQFEPVLRANPYIDKLWLYDNNFKEIIPQLKAGDYNYIIDLHGNYRSAFVKRHFNNNISTFSKLNLRKWLAVHLKLNVLPDIHIVDRYFMAAGLLQLRNDGLGLDYFIEPEEEVPMSALPVSHQKGYIAVVIGAKHATKLFPVEKVAEVCRKLMKPVVLLGGKEDRNRGEAIVGATNQLVYNACGLYTLNQSASVVRQASATLTNDTGLMHIAAAFNKPIVSVWGNTIPAFGMYPYRPLNNPAPSLVAEVKSLSCRPCSKIGFKQCPKKHFKCMNEIEIEPVIAFLQSNFKP